MRESPAFEVIHLLLGLGAKVAYRDPYVPVAPRYELVAKHAKLVVDTRGVFREPRANVVKA